MAKTSLFPTNSGGLFKNKWVKIAVAVLAIVIIIGVLSYIKKASDIAKAAAGDIAGSKIIEDKLQISPSRQVVCKQAAADCWDACTVPLFTSWVAWVDDDKVVDALNRLVSDNEAILTSQFFRELSGKSLKGIVEGGCFVEKNRKRITKRSSLT